MEQERRDVPRTRALKAGRAILAGGHSTFDCMVRNLSQAGAKVQFESTVDIPADFQLRFEDGTTHGCHVRWRTARELGVEFTDRKLN